MLSKFFKFILFNLLFLLSFVTLFAIFVRFAILNTLFYTYSFNKNGVYENLAKGIKNAATDALTQQFSKTENYSSMTIDERQEVEKQVESFTSFINKDAVKDFLEVNIANITSYLNNKADILYIYLPIGKWGLPGETTNNIPQYLKDTNIDTRDILKNTKRDSAENLIFLENLKYSSKYVDYAITVGVVSEIIFVFFYLLVSKKGTRYQSLGKLFSLLGVLTLILSWMSYTASKIVTEGLAYKTNWSEIVSGTLLPIFLQPLIIVFTIFGLVALVIGIVLYNKTGKNQLVNEAK